MIFYFSCTGNTKWAARVVADITGDRLVDIAELMRNDGKTFQCILAENEAIGFCFPVHGWRPPIIVRQFIKRLEVKYTSEPYCWALCTAGDDIGQTMEILNRDLSRIGLKTDSTFSLIMPESYVGLPFMDVDTAKKEKQKKEKAATYVRLFGNTIAHREKDINDTYKGHWPKTNSWFLGSLFKGLLISDKPFRIDEDKCTQCGLCSKVCPVDNIVSGKGKTTEWLHNGKCLTCFACYHHCPAKAIEYGKRTKKKGQYYFERNKHQ